MRQSRQRQVIAVVLRGYPARWRARHGDEAAELASALLDDGTPWWFIVGSFLGGAAKERVFRKPSVRVGSFLAVLMIGIAGTPLAFFASLTPASAATTTTIVISQPGDAVQQLESAFAHHHFRIAVVERPVPTDIVGAILSVTTVGVSSRGADAIGEIHGQCSGGGADCVVGLVLPLHYSGSVRVTVGAATTPNEVRHDSLEPRQS